MSCKGGIPRSGVVDTRPGSQFTAVIISDARLSSRGCRSLRVLQRRPSCSRVLSCFFRPATTILLPRPTARGFLQESCLFSGVWGQAILSTLLRKPEAGPPSTTARGQRCSGQERAGSGRTAAQAASLHHLRALLCRGRPGPWFSVFNLVITSGLSSVELRTSWVFSQLCSERLEQGQTHAWCVITACSVTVSMKWR